MGGSDWSKWKRAKQIFKTRSVICRYSHCTYLYLYVVCMPTCAIIRFTFLCAYVKMDWCCRGMACCSTMGHWCHLQGINLETSLLWSWLAACLLSTSTMVVGPPVCHWMDVIPVTIVSLTACRMAAGTKLRLFAKGRWEFSHPISYMHGIELFLAFPLMSFPGF